MAVRALAAVMAELKEKLERRRGTAAARKQSIKTVLTNGCNRLRTVFDIPGNELSTAPCGRQTFVDTSAPHCP